MKKLLTLFALLLSLSVVKAQQIPDGYVLVDSLVYIPTAGVDTTLAGRNVFDLLSSPVHQSEQTVQGMEQHISSNRSRNISGYRVRVFFDNKQDSRVASEAIVNRFREQYPGVSVYRSYSAPFFKVTIGDCRTRSEAMQLLQSVKADYPTAFVVRETIAYPPVDKEHAYIVDTVKVLRPITQSEAD